MPQTRYYHQGRYYRPARPMPLLPPLSLVPAVDPSKHDQLRLGIPAEDEDTVERRWKTKRDKEFRWMIRYIGESLTGDNIADIKFLCREHITPSEALRRPMKGPRLMTILEKQRLLAENSLFFLQTLLYYIARPDLYEMVFDFRSQRQNDFRKKGVEIMYDMKQPHDRGLSLSTDLKTFRRELKPRSRLKNVDVPALERKLAELRARMQSKIPERGLDPSQSMYLISSLPRSDASDSEWSEQFTDITGDDEQDGKDENDINLKMSSDSNSKMIKDESQMNSDSISANKMNEVLHRPAIKSKDVNDNQVNDKNLDVNDDDGDVDDEATEEKSVKNGVEQLKSRPVFYNRSTNFSDLKVEGRQTFTDDDIIDRVRDVNKIGRASRYGSDGLGSKLSTLPEIGRSRPKVPRKIRVLRERIRRDSPARRLRNVASKKRISNPLAKIRSTRTVPKHEAESVNFLPDIYDKYARRQSNVSLSKGKKR